MSKRFICLIEYTDGDSTIREGDTGSIYALLERNTHSGVIVFGGIGVPVDVFSLCFKEVTDED